MRAWAKPGLGWPGAGRPPCCRPPGRTAPWPAVAPWPGPSVKKNQASYYADRLCTCVHANILTACTPRPAPPSCSARRVAVWRVAGGYQGAPEGLAAAGGLTAYSVSQVVRLGLLHTAAHIRRYRPGPGRLRDEGSSLRRT